jgi:hypothetical protein
LFRLKTHPQPCAADFLFQAAAERGPITGSIFAKSLPTSRSAVRLS